MSDFEERLRATVNRRSDDFEPSADLPDRIEARVRQHQRRRQVVTGGLVSVAATVLAVMAVVGFRGRDEESPIRMTGPDETSTTTSSTTSTTEATTTSTTTTTTAAPSGQRIDILTPMTRQGLGPITAGMTLREAQDAGGLSITPPPAGGACGEAHLVGLYPSIWMAVEPPAEPGADPMDAVVRAIGGSVLPTAEGAIVGQSVDELVAALGQPTRSEAKEGPWGGGQILVFEDGGFAYGALVTGSSTVMSLQSGDPAWVDEPEGCPE